MTVKNFVSRRTALAGLAVITRNLFAIDTREAAPKFRAKTLDGETVTNDSAHGKVLLVQFWTTWCPYCRRDQPAVEAISEEFSAQGLVVLGVNVGESKKTIKRFLEKTPRSTKI